MIFNETINRVQDKIKHNHEQFKSNHTHLNGEVQALIVKIEKESMKFQKNWSPEEWKHIRVPPHVQWRWMGKE